MALIFGPPDDDIPIPNIIVGTPGDDSLDGTNDRDFIHGLEGNDTINGLVGNDVIYGNRNGDPFNSGDDVLDGGNGDDRILGQDGNDIIRGGRGGDSLDGGAGSDILLEYASGDVTLSNTPTGGQLKSSSGTDSFVSMEAVIIQGGNANDTFDAQNFSTRVTLKGNAGDDILRGGFDNDLLDGGAGNDVLDAVLFGIDTLIGGAGNDTYRVQGNNEIINEDFLGGVDSVEAVDSFTLPANVENLTILDLGVAGDGTGNGLSNRLTGNSLNNMLVGLGGNDVINGGTGNDVLNGGVGNDAINGEAGGDSINGGTGNDTLVGLDGNDRLVGGAGNDILDAGRPVLQSSEVDRLTGGVGEDRFVLTDREFGVYYRGVGFATLTDFSRDEGDRIRLFGNAGQYAFNSSGSNTLIRLQGTNDTLAVVQNATVADVSASIIFV